MKIKIIVSGILFLVLSLVLVACGGSGTTGSSEAPPVDAGADADFSNEEYIFVSSMGNLEYFNAIKYGWTWAGDTLGVKVSYVGPAENDVPAQVAAFDQAIAKKPAGIAVFAYDPAIIPSINKAIEAGIPVVTVIGDVPGSERIAFVGSSQYDLGYVAGENLAEALGGEGKVAILSLPGVQMFDDREAGIRAAFAAYPGIEVVQVGDTKADTVTAVSVAKDIMQRNPDLVAFIGTDSTAGIGAATAIEEAEKIGEVLAVAMDRNSDVLAKIEKGSLTGAVAQDDAAQSFWALLTLFNFNHNQAPLTVDNPAANANSGPTLINTNANYIDKSNLQYYLDANALYAEN